MLKVVTYVHCMCNSVLSKIQIYFGTESHAHNHFTALWTLSGATPVSWYQKVHFAIFWIFWCIMKLTQAGASTIWMDCYLD